MSVAPQPVRLWRQRRTLYWGAVWAIVRKDVTLELRERVMLAAMFGLALIALLLFGLTIQLSPNVVGSAMPGILWVIFSFAGMLGLGRSFTAEREQECLDGLLLGVGDPSALLIGKVLTSLLYMLLIEVITLALATLLFDLRLHWLLAPVFVLGSLGFAIVGTFFSAVSVQARCRDLLLPVLVLPLMIPALVAAAHLTGALLSEGTWAGLDHWLHLLIGFDVIYGTVAMLAFEAVMEE